MIYIYILAGLCVSCVCLCIINQYPCMHVYSIGCCAPSTSLILLEKSDRSVSFVSVLKPCTCHKIYGMSQDGRHNAYAHTHMPPHKACSVHLEAVLRVSRSVKLVWYAYLNLLDLVEGQIQPREVHEEVDVLDLGDAVVVQAQLRQRPVVEHTKTETQCGEEKD